MSIFNNIMNSHAVKKNSIDKNVNLAGEIQNPFKGSKNESCKHSKAQNQNFFYKVDGRGDSSCKISRNSEYSASNFYGNDYTNSAHTSQFTFGATPDSRMSDRGFSGNNSVNKSISKDKILYSMKDAIKQKKLKDKQKKLPGHESHRRVDSKNSKKSK